MLSPTEALVTFVALVALFALYAGGAYLAFRYARWTRRWPWVAVIVFCAVAAIYAPFWLPVWAVGRWIRGPKPPSILDVDRETARKTMLAVDDLTRHRSLEQQAELYRRWRDNPGVPPPFEVSAGDWVRLVEQRGLTPEDRPTFRWIPPA